ncbi:GIY-YIG nuclease family protein [Salinigranum halophilum]|uniref:GIY-YIG nuclease family protein n=1 Tax=Salinigranum halophilum TaxID=2565931 RepID=UPI0010A94878|nr:GIY-YIG nuclease family protein [Salinigranum halophilum]
MGLDEFGAGRTAVQERVEEFKSKRRERHVRSAVYGIYDRQSGECLYIGEAKWLISRLNDHYNTRSGSQIKAFVEADDGIDIDASTVWGRTDVKYVSGIDGGKQGRRRVEAALIRELEPRYNSR